MIKFLLFIGYLFIAGAILSFSQDSQDGYNDNFGFFMLAILWPITLAFALLALMCAIPMVAGCMSFTLIKSTVSGTSKQVGDE